MGQNGLNTVDSSLQIVKAHLPVLTLGDSQRHPSKDLKASYNAAAPC